MHGIALHSPPASLIYSSLNNALPHTPHTHNLCLFLSPIYMHTALFCCTAALPAHLFLFLHTCLLFLFLLSFLSLFLFIYTHICITFYANPISVWFTTTTTFPIHLTSSLHTCSRRISKRNYYFGEQCEHFQVSPIHPLMGEGTFSLLPIPTSPPWSQISSSSACLPRISSLESKSL